MGRPVKQNNIPPCVLNAYSTGDDSPGTDTRRNNTIIETSLLVLAARHSPFLPIRLGDEGGLRGETRGPAYPHTRPDTDTHGHARRRRCAFRVFRDGGPTDRSIHPSAQHTPL